MAKFNSDPRSSISYTSNVKTNTSSASPPVNQSILNINSTPPITPQPTNNQFNSDPRDSGAAIGAVIAGAAAHPPIALVVGGIVLGGILIAAAIDYFESN